MDHVLLVFIAAALVLAMSGAWAIQRLSAASGWIDTIWAAAVGLAGMAAALFAQGVFDRRIAAAILVLLWSARLGGHIGWRTRQGGEDPRYAKLIEEWGASAAWRLFAFLQIQALAAFVLVFAIYEAAARSAAFPTVWDIFAVLLGTVALAGEALADWQLAQFRKSPQAKVDICETGLWRYSRHPNYFFEWLFWCAWPLMALSLDLWTWLSLLAPAMMYWLLVHVSGIPPLEEHMLHSRGEKFRALQSRTNAFFPGPRKNPNR